jgi:predicted signal transduction protein with EAL and GGDEF domain
MVKVITLITVITCALCLQLSNVSAIILTHLININSDALANFLTNTAPALEKAAY